MIPSNFEGSNAIFGPPKGASEDQVCSVFAHKDDETHMVTTCWQLTQEELDHINKTGRVWCEQLGGMVPTQLSAFQPDQIR